MDNVTNWLLGQRLLERMQNPMPTAMDLPLASSQEPVTRPIPYLSWNQGPSTDRRAPANELWPAPTPYDQSELQDEALAAQRAREAAAMRMQRAVRPPGGRQEGALTEFVRDAVIPQSPLDYGLYALGAPFLRPAVRAGMLGLGAAMESSPAEAGVLRRLGSRIAQRFSGGGGPVGGTRPHWLQPEDFPAPPGLPMDPASVFGRQQAMQMDSFMSLGHGTGWRFNAFSPARLGSNTGSPQARRAIWLEVNPRPGGIAEEFALMAAQQPGGTPIVMPLLHRFNRRGEINLTGRESREEISEILNRAVQEHWARGYDALLVNNYRSPGNVIGTTLAIRDGSQLRFPWARFDPARMFDRELTAGIAGAAALPPLVGAFVADHDPFANVR